MVMLRVLPFLWSSGMADFGKKFNPKKQGTAVLNKGIVLVTVQKFPESVKDRTLTLVEECVYKCN